MVNDITAKIHNSYQKYYKALRIIPETHFIAEEGYLYGAKQQFTVPSESSIYILGRTDAIQEAHMQERVLNMVSQQAIDMEIHLYKDATVTDAGTAISVTNTNLNFDNGYTFKLYLTPTYSDIGTLVPIFDFFKKTENKISTEIINLGFATLKKDSDHILQFKNNGTGDLIIDYKIFWHEVPKV